jgi:hypothetical protein
MAKIQMVSDLKREIKELWVDIKNADDVKNYQKPFIFVIAVILYIVFTIFDLVEKPLSGDIKNE